MRLELQIIAAVLLDLLVGDPRWMPHPVRWMGRLAAWVEAPLRRLIPGERPAGIAAALLVVLLSGGAALLLLRLAGLLHPLFADGMSVWLIYTTIAIRDMRRHSSAVQAALVEGDLEDARGAVGMIVGRDTESLNEGGVARAAVESVAESIVDGVTAPLFFALLAGPVGAVAYRAINTLDSMFGYKNERYRRFGWASARLDDVANYVPARLTAPLVCLAALLVGRPAGRAARMLVRDRGNHTSPNSGLTEAAMAGALGVQLGGTNLYFGEPVEKPTIGEGDRDLTADHIRQANRLAFVTCMLFLLGGVGLRLLLLALTGGYGR